MTTGLSQWGEKKLVCFRRKAGLKLLKLHGSLNWSGSREDLKVRDGDIKPYEKRAMVFGGLDNKLSAEGPFLQLLFTLERELAACDRLIIVGYSFRDSHINSVISRRRFTKDRTKMIVIDPTPPQIWRLGFVDGKIKKVVQGQEVEGLAQVRILPVIASIGIKIALNDQALFKRSPQEVHQQFAKGAA